MSSGWFYLHDDSDSDGEGVYSPVTLPDGRLVCYRHLQIICAKCCVDYSFVEPNSDLDKDLDDDDSADFNDNDEPLTGEHIARGRPGTTTSPRQNEDDLMMETALGGLGRPKTRGTGRVIPTKFNPPSPTSTPASVFPGRATCGQITRFTHRQDPRKVLVFTDGACINNGQANPKAGWAFVHGPRAQGDPGNDPARFTAGRLEKKGPFGDAGGQTSNRAEMRAAIAALRFRHWPGEGFESMVIATDSEYVVEGATGWVRGWIRNGWKTRTGGDVKNKDLWECLLGDIERFQVEYGMRVEFWRIPRELNGIADSAAKTAAAKEEVVGFQDTLGILI